jgi:hypothetical protein
MTEQKPSANAATAPGRPIPEQVVREPRTPDVTRPVVPDQAVAPAEETVAATVEEALPTAADAEPAVEDAGAHRPRRRLRRRRAPKHQSAFRRWRKTRPFWGGLFTILAGAEIAAVTGASYELLFVSKSVGFAIAVGAVIAVFGLTMWLSPALSKLLGLLTFVAALLSFVTSNLGGFMLGMLLAILGGGLSFAWEPGRPPVDPTAPENAENAEDAADEPADGADERDGQPAEEYRPLDELFGD